MLATSEKPHYNNGKHSLRRIKLNENNEFMEILIKRSGKII